MNETSHGVLPMARDCDSSCEVGFCCEGTSVTLCGRVLCVFRHHNCSGRPTLPSVCHSQRPSLPCQGCNQVQAQLHTHVICLGTGATQPWAEQEGVPRCQQGQGQQERARLRCGTQVNIYPEFLLFGNSSVLDPLPKQNLAHVPSQRPSLTCPQTLGDVESVIFGDWDLTFIWEE